MSSVWQIHLLGGLRLQHGSEYITRFRSQKFGALLAYLSLFPQRLHSREELAELFWPDADPEMARGNLRTALASLRRQLEPPGTETGSVLATQGRTYIALSTDGYTTDVAEFETALANAARADTPEQRTRYLVRAVNAYDGPLLPGIYESWAINERERLADAHRRALRQLAILQENAGDADAALDAARRAVAADASSEESHALLIRLLVASGQMAAAKRQYDEMVRLLQENLRIKPSAQTQALLDPLPPAIRVAVDRQATSANSFAVAARPAPESAPAASVATLAPSPPKETPNNLPINRSRFFGREDEIVAIGARLGAPATRLVTLTGPGGSGKTRTALETARALVERFPGGVWFVPLADVRDAERIPGAIADTLGIKKQAADSEMLLNQIAQLLSPPVPFDSEPIPVLLVLDNFEQLADNGAAIINTLLQWARAVRCLVTSRQRLRIDAEHEFPLLPLPVPEYPGTPERLREFASVQLFVSRAQQARSDFQLTGRNAAAVAALCTKLEGIPLAIELAAAWSATLTPAQILERMEKRLDLLVSRRRDIAPRHRTLRAAMESSVALLAPEVQQFFARLSVFRGSWTLEAAEEVCDEPNALDFLTVLLDHSLVQNTFADDNGDVRFRMLETVREFAAELLQSEEGVADAIANQHTAFFVRLAAPGDLSQGTYPSSDWFVAMEKDHDNLRAVLDRLVAAGAAEAAFEFACTLIPFWQTRGFVTEARQRLTALIHQVGDKVDILVRARILSTCGKFAYLQSDYAAARAAHDACLATYQEADHREGLARTYCELANTEMLHANYSEAMEYGKQSLAAYRTIDDAKGLGIMLNNLGAISLAKGQPDTALPYLEESLVHSRKAGNERMVAVSLVCLASIAQSEKDLPRARSLYEQSLAIRLKLGDIATIGRVQEGLARVAMEEGKAEEALRYFDESLYSQRRIEHKEGIASLLFYRGLTLLRLKNDTPGADESFRASLQQSKEIGHRHFAWLALGGLAALAAREGQAARAAQLWGAADALRGAMGVTAIPAEAQIQGSEITAAKATLGDDAFQAAWDAGQAMPFEAMLDFALNRE